MKNTCIGALQMTKMFAMNFYIPLATPTVHTFILDIYISCFIHRFQPITAVEDVNNTAS